MISKAGFLQTIWYSKKCFHCIFCFTDSPVVVHTNSSVTIFFFIYKKGIWFLAGGIFLGGVRAEMFLQESTGQGREIASREEPPNVGSINSSSNLCREL